MRAWAALLAPVPPRVIGKIPELILSALIPVTGIVMLLSPLKAVGVPVTPPDIPIVLATTNLSALTSVTGIVTFWVPLKF